MGLVKNWCDHSGCGTLKLAVSQEVTDGKKTVFCMLLQIQESLKLLQWFLIRVGQKWACKPK